MYLKSSERSATGPSLNSKTKPGLKLNCRQNTSATLWSTRESLSKPSISSSYSLTCLKDKKNENFF